MLTPAMDITTDSSCRRPTDPNLPFSGHYGLSSSLDPWASTWPQVARPQVSAEPMVESGVKYITPDPGLHRATDSGMALGSSSLCQDVFMALGISIGHPDQHGPGHSMVVGH